MTGHRRYRCQPLPLSLEDPIVGYIRYSPPPLQVPAVTGPSRYRSQPLQVPAVTGPSRYKSQPLQATTAVTSPSRYGRAWRLHAFSALSLLQPRPLADHRQWLAGEDWR